VKFADKDRQATKHTSTTASSNANHLKTSTSENITGNSTNVIGAIKEKGYAVRFIRTGKLACVHLHRNKVNNDVSFLITR